MAIETDTPQLKEKVFQGLRIYQASLADADLVAMMVFELLKELGNSFTPAEENRMFRTCREILEEDSLSKALIALDNQNKPLSVMTLAEVHGLFALGRFGMIMEHYVVPEARSMGVGEKMLEAAIKLGRQTGWTMLQVAAPGVEMGQRTENFYKNHLFKTVGKHMQFNL